MATYRIVIPVNCKAGIHKELPSWVSPENYTLAQIRTVCSFFTPYEAYVEQWNPVLDMWVEVPHQQTEESNVRLIA